MKRIIKLFVFLTFISCNQNNKYKDANNEITDSKKALNKKIIESFSKKINYDINEEFIGQGGIYSFKAPKGLFIKNGDTFLSEQLQAKIKFTSYYTNRFDESGFFSKNDLIKKYKGAIRSTYFFDKNDWFVLSGYDEENKIVYVKGFYQELVSMQGRDFGEPSWLWSKSGILEIQYTERYKKEFDRLIPIITKSFKCDFSNLY